MKNSVHKSRPIRSFRPQTAKPVKPMHFRGQGAKYIGEVEPSWPSVEIQQEWNLSEYNSKLSEALNWYSQTQDDNEIIKAGMAALELSGHFPELTVTIKNSTLSFSLTAAKLIRMAHAGLSLRFRERRYIVKQIKLCVANQKEIVEKTETASTKPNIQDYLNIKIRKVKGEIDAQFDTFVIGNYVTNAKKKSVIDTVLNDKDNSIPANRAKDLTEYCQRYLDEYKYAYAEKMPYAEAYENVGKRKIKSAIEWWEQAITDINSFAHQKQSMQKTRTRKPKPPAKIVGKLKFVREFKELGLKSIDPTQILKCSELWVYNTRLRKLGHYVSLNEMAFEIKGTKLTNIDTVKSVQKTLRKPAEQLKEFSNYGKPGAIKWFNSIKAVATPLREAINKECILLKASK